MSNHLVWLHLSDLHFCEPKTGLDSARILRTLLDDLRDLQSTEGLRPDLIFFTGDAVFGHLGKDPGYSITSQFEEAANFFEKVRKAFRKPPTKGNVFVVPGNHDINREHVLPFHTEWLGSKERTAQQINACIREAGPQWKEFMKRLTEYRVFLEKNYPHLLTDPDRAVYSLSRTIKGVKVGIAGLNTAWSCCDNEERGKLHFGGEWQVKAVYERLRKVDIRIALMHHPTTWLTELEEPTVGREIERDFHFALHGHEHKDWVTRINDGHVRIAAGASYVYSQEPNSYNFVRLNLATGDIEVWQRKYHPGGGKWGHEPIPGQTDEQGVWRFTLKLPARPVIALPPPPKCPDDAPKPAPRPATGADNLPVRCKSHTMYADIIFPSGDLVLREIIEGLEWTGEESTRQIPLLSFASRIWPEGVVRVKSLTHTYTVKTNPRKNVRLADTQEGPIYAYFVDFEPGLARGHTPITLVCQRAWFGVMYSSVEDKKRIDTSEVRENIDQYLKRVRWDCDRVFIHVRCWPHNWPHLMLIPTVVNDQGAEADHELNSPNVITSVWAPPVSEPYHLPFVSSSEGFIAIDHPHRGYSYGFRWPLPPADKPPPQWVLHLRDRFARLHDEPNLAQMVENCLRDLLLSTQGLLDGASHDSPHNSEPMHGYFFVPDASFNVLTCQASTAPPTDFLRGHTVRWGQDAVGTACRRRHSIFFSGTRVTPREFPASSEEFLTRVRALLAYPIMPEEDYVVGVIAVASSYPPDAEPPSEPGALAELAANSKFCRRWDNEVLAIWNEHFKLLRHPISPP